MNKRLSGEGENRSRCLCGETRQRTVLRVWTFSIPQRPTCKRFGSRGTRSRKCYGPAPQRELWDTSWLFLWFLVGFVTLCSSSSPSVISYPWERPSQCLAHHCDKVHDESILRNGASWLEGLPSIVVGDAQQQSVTQWSRSTTVGKERRSMQLLRWLLLLPSAFWCQHREQIFSPPLILSGNSLMGMPEKYLLGGSKPRQVMEKGKQPSELGPRNQKKTLFTQCHKGEKLTGRR